jgi:anaerobic magnesium-protoporphyrin IX monomethyl ester cyclase
MKQANQSALRDGRLDGRLGNNELREYLEQKHETSRLGICDVRAVDLRDVGHPLDHRPRVLLIGPSITIPRYMLKRCIPPLGLSCIAAFLESRGHDVAILDCCVEGYEVERLNGSLLTYGLTPEMLAERLRQECPDVIGVSILFSTDLFNLFEICRVAKSIHPHVPVVVGGLHATIYPREIFDLDLELNDGVRTVDWVIRGEGEKRLAEFVELLQSGKVDRAADGLAGFLDGEFFCNPQRTTIQHLDDLPFPAYHLLPMEKYFEINVPFAPAPIGDRVAQLLTSRGCPIGCTFCASTNMYKAYRTRSVANVAAEVEHLKEAFGVDELQFADDNLTLDRSHTMELMAGLESTGLPWCTANGTMVNTLTPQLIEVMARAGLYQLTLSLDSGSARTLKELHHKPVDLDRLPELIAKCQELGVWTHGTLVVGMPGETEEEIQSGLAFVLNDLDFTSISTFIAQPIPGSELFHAALDAGLTTRQEAYAIDTTKCKMSLSDIPPDRLEAIVMEFQSAFTEQAKRRDPETHAKKYGRLIARELVSGHCGGRLT